MSDAKDQAKTESHGAKSSSFPDAPASPLSHYERLGGREGLMPIIDAFIENVTADMMIGFFFRNVDKAQLKEHEFAFAAAHLGGPSEYGGRPLRNAHANHRIMGGQFNRRLRILDRTLREHAVPEDIISAWLQHNEALRSHVTRDSAVECIGDGFADAQSASKSEQASTETESEKST